VSMLPKANQKVSKGKKAAIFRQKAKKV